MEQKIQSRRMLVKAQHKIFEVLLRFVMDNPANQKVRLWSHFFFPSAYLLWALPF